ETVFVLHKHAFRVRFALNLKGLPYDYLEITSFSDLDQFDFLFYLCSKFLKLNPIGFVPVLVDGDSVIVDSLAIIMYLEDKYLDPPQLPHDIHQRAINFQKYIGGKVGADEKLPWTQSVIGKGFMGEFKLNY
ncbi:Glutathione S-transferase zeta class, partial [Glycine soja]